MWHTAGWPFRKAWKTWKTWKTSHRRKKFTDARQPAAAQQLCIAGAMERARSMLVTSRRISVPTPWVVTKQKRDHQKQQSVCNPWSLFVLFTARVGGVPSRDSLPKLTTSVTKKCVQKPEKAPSACHRPCPASPKAPAVREAALERNSDCLGPKARCTLLAQTSSQSPCRSAKLRAGHGPKTPAEPAESEAFRASRSAPPR